MEFIRQFFEKSAKLTDGEWAIFSSKVKRRTFAKKALLLKTGEVENYLSFIETGLVRFYVPGEENDRTFAFAFAGGFVGAYESFLTRTPCTYHCEALAQTVLWSIAHADLQEVYATTRVGDRIGRFAAEELFIKKSKRELSLLHESAEKRYLNLFSEQPELIRHIPLKYIASYIGITPQALSRIRRNVW